MLPSIIRTKALLKRTQATHLTTQFQAIRSTSYLMNCLIGIMCCKALISMKPSTSPNHNRHTKLKSVVYETFIGILLEVYTKYW